MVDSANSIWRDNVIPGVPSSGDNEPDKAKIREWGTDVEQNMVRSSTVRNLVRLTQTSYNALPSKDAQTLYIIVG
jgi:hypothetical protein